ncbi:MAG: hypothetical protein ABI900_09960 [Betaproteobacteria bacterium]
MNCDSLTLTGNPPNQVLTCNIGSAAPSGCSIQGPASGLIGTPITLTAVCSVGTAPLTYTWSGGSAASCGNTQACSVSDSATTTYTVGIANGQGAASPSPTKQVTWSNTPIAPSGCVLNASTTSLPVGGGTVSLSMDCSAGSGLSYAWTGGFAAGASTQQVSGTLAATTTFTATASNSSGTVTKTSTVTVATGGGAISCSGYLNTNVITMNWGSWLPNQIAPMGPLDATVVKFTTGSVVTTGRFTATNSPAANASTKHDYTLSATACDFGKGLKQQADAGTSAIGFTINDPTRTPTLAPNSTYYINIRNSGTQGCAINGGSCDLNPVSMYSP